MSYHSLIHNASQGECISDQVRKVRKREKGHARAAYDRRCTNEIARVCVYVRVCARASNCEKEGVREGEATRVGSVFFAGHRRSTVGDTLFRAIDESSRAGRPVLVSPPPRPPRNRRRATPSIQRYPPQPGSLVARGARKNGVTYARSWRYIPLYAKSRGTPAISRYGR